jgi:hypothetical protein
MRQCLKFEIRGFKEQGITNHLQSHFIHIIRIFKCLLKINRKRHAKKQIKKDTSEFFRRQSAIPNNTVSS